VFFYKYFIFFPRWMNYTGGVKISFLIKLKLWCNRSCFNDADVYDEKIEAHNFNLNFLNYSAEACMGSWAKGHNDPISLSSHNYIFMKNKFRLVATIMLFFLKYLEYCVHLLYFTTILCVLQSKDFFVAQFNPSSKLIFSLLFLRLEHSEWYLEKERDCYLSIW